jgi:NTE family protein
VNCFRFSPIILNFTFFSQFIMPYQVGFVLSGGGARGFAHLGMLDAFLEMGIIPDVISGVSAGAIAGAFFSSGKTPHEIHQILKTGNFFKFTAITLPVNGLLKLNGLQKVIEKEIPFKRIEDLPIPLFVGVSNLTDGMVEYLNNGVLSKLVLASASIPVLFSPVNIDGKLYCDGGLLENIPIAPLLGKCGKIVVFNISPLQKPAEIKNLVQMVTRTFHVSIHSRINTAKKHADIYIEPEELTHFDLLSAGHADEAYEIGYKAVTKMKGYIKEIFEMAQKKH